MICYSVAFLDPSVYWRLTMARPQFPKPGHDHGACMNRSLERARTAYRARGARLTDLRESVLRELAGSHRALGAYDIIQQLGAHGRHVAPISVYRVLESLLQVGLIHRIESQNAYVACHAAHESARPILFLVCERCGTVAESSAPELQETLDRVAGAVQFALSDTVMEVTGLCEHCAHHGG